MSDIYKEFLDAMDTYRGNLLHNANLRLCLFTSSYNGGYPKYIYPSRSGFMLDVRPAIKTPDYTSFWGSFKPGGAPPVHQEERPMIDFNRPLQTEDGRTVKILSTFGALPEPILGVVDPEGPSPFNASWRLDGTVAWRTRGLSLRNVPEKVTRYLNVYRRTGALRAGLVYESRQDADLNARDTRVACVKIELVEGQYDE